MHCAIVTRFTNNENELQKPRRRKHKRRTDEGSTSRQEHIPQPEEAASESPVPAPATHLQVQRERLQNFVCVVAAFAHRHKKKTPSVQTFSNMVQEFGKITKLSDGTEFHPWVYHSKQMPELEVIFRRAQDRLKYGTPVYGCYDLLKDDRESGEIIDVNAETSGQGVSTFEALTSDQLDDVVEEGIKVARKGSDAFTSKCLRFLHPRWPSSRNRTTNSQTVD